jgi:AcrR family transcriptional regulator
MAHAEADQNLAPVAPNERAPERRRQELLQAAIAEFAAHGFAGARMQVIADRTNSNKALIYSYFGNKQDLYLEVLEFLYSSIRAAEQELALESLPPVEALECLVRFTFKYYVDNPDFVAILSNENLMQARFLRKSTSAPAVNRPIIAMLVNILRRGADAGLFRSGIDPVDFYISISALGFMYVSNRHTLGIAFGRDLMGPDQLSCRLASITDIILRAVALLPDAQRPPEPPLQPAL